MTIHEITFTSRQAYQLWVKERGNEVAIIYQSDLWNEFGYEASARLDRPDIVVRYISFEED